METITLKTTRPILHEFARYKARGYRPEDMVDHVELSDFATRLANVTATRGVRTVTIELTDPLDPKA